ncbi:hypothetical protein [Phenylobacterium sp.]|jgi:hypothetical protein|uniref:hypothetical protein n=1 Tax=Phenylobacterium sp. TaxID=1871053 RepID=UPI002F3FCC8F
MTGRATRVLAACAGVSAALAGAAAQAQWSIGAPGDRLAPAGAHRYAMLLFSNPVPGREAEFNDWYQNVHLGDLVQLEGWTGAQRFRIVTTVKPPPAAEARRQGYLTIWDQEGAEPQGPAARMAAAFRAGKVRLSPAIDTGPGAVASATYEATGPRTPRNPPAPAPNPDAPRPNRYAVLDFSDPPAGAEAKFDALVDQRIKAVLAVPGWVAAQRFRRTPAAAGAPAPGKPSRLVVWEVQAPSAQAALDSLASAIAAGAVAAPPADPRTAEVVFWEPISPYVTKDLVVR